MSKLIINNVLRFLLLIVLQVMILNYVYLGGYVIPFIYILAIMMLPTRYGNIPLLLTAFALGMLIDVFCNIPGFHAFCCTMMAFARIIIGNRMLTRDDPDAVIDTPSIFSVPFQTFASYAFVMSLVFCFAYGMVEAFSFGNFGMTFLAILINTLTSWTLVMLSQMLITSKKK
ncbi:MAG: hypothetical protein MJZ99_08650 [Bacteroidales bacterium]|nr:hypothetical protein [Candidatus Colimorpha merdihippi]MCQ2274507.1 hypothetical protein [Bacteroidales bacterium]MCQ2282678.1 hypothetical protein [Bacteroidales bacterium]